MVLSQFKLKKSLLIRYIKFNFYYLNDKWSDIKRWEMKDYLRE